MSTALVSAMAELDTDLPVQAKMVADVASARTQAPLAVGIIDHDQGASTAATWTISGRGAISPSMLKTPSVLMRRRRTGVVRTMIMIFVNPPVFPQMQTQQPSQSQQRDHMRWDQEAEQTFGLGRGMGRQHMTQEEWQEHHQRMQQMTAQEREQYRNEWHAKMQERAKEKGMTLPDSPEPHGRGQGGPHGMDHGQGMGGGKR